MSKDKVINVNPFHAEIEIKDGKFTLIFFDNIGGDYSRRKLVKIHLENWWLRFLASLLWKVQRHQAEVSQEMAKSLKGKDHE